jgi:hypothetical protein
MQQIIADRIQACLAVATGAAAAGCDACGDGNDCRLTSPEKATG